VGLIKQCRRLRPPLPQPTPPSAFARALNFAAIAVLSSDFRANTASEQLHKPSWPEHISIGTHCALRFVHLPFHLPSP
jgi:hypothetical protein